MNGYELTANSYRKLLENETDHEAIKDLQSKLKVYSFLSDISQSERLEIFNSGAFNDVCKGYMLAALDRIGVDPETRKQAVYAMGAEFENMTAEEAQGYYLNK